MKSRCLFLSTSLSDTHTHTHIMSYRKQVYLIMLWRQLMQLCCQIWNLLTKYTGIVPHLCRQLQTEFQTKTLSCNSTCVMPTVMPVTYCCTCNDSWLIRSCVCAANKSCSRVSAVLRHWSHSKVDFCNCDSICRYCWFVRANSEDTFETRSNSDLWRTSASDNCIFNRELWTKIQHLVKMSVAFEMEIVNMIAIEKETTRRKKWRWWRKEKKRNQSKSNKALLREKGVFESMVVAACSNGPPMAILLLHQNHDAPRFPKLHSVHATLLAESRAVRTRQVSFLAMWPAPFSNRSPSFHWW